MIRRPFARRSRQRARVHLVVVLNHDDHVSLTQPSDSLVSLSSLSSVYYIILCTRSIFVPVYSYGVRVLSTVSGRRLRTCDEKPHARKQSDHRQPDREDRHGDRGGQIGRQRETRISLRKITDIIEAVPQRRKHKFPSGKTLLLPFLLSQSFDISVRKP